MKNKGSGTTIIPAIVFLAVIWSGCVTIHDEVFLQNAELDGGIAQLPVHITTSPMKEHNLRVSPHVSVGLQRQWATGLKKQYSKAIPDTLEDFQWKGVRWHIPIVRFGFDLDYGLGKNVSNMLGVSSSLGDERQFLNAYYGIGFSSVDSSAGFRLNFGLQYNEISYRSATVLVRQISGKFSSSETYYLVDRGKDYHLNLFADMTLNTSRSDWFLNYFFQVGVCPQSLTSFTPENSDAEEHNPFVVSHVKSDGRAETSVFWLNGTAGVFFRVGDSQRVVTGLRFLKDLKNESGSSGLLVIPVVQFDWTF
jgi:hypothetical protein